MRIAVTFQASFSLPLNLLSDFVVLHFETNLGIVPTQKSNPFEKMRWEDEAFSRRDEDGAPVSLVGMPISP